MDLWSSFALGTDGLSARYCELNHLGDFLRQPSNALSSLIYIGAGLLVFFRRRPHRDLVQPAFSNVLALSLVGLGLGSHFFHASLILVAQELDMAATYAVVLALIAIGLAQRFRGLDARLLLAALLVCDGVFYALDFYLYGPWLLPLLLGIALITAIVVAFGPTARHVRSTLGLAVLALATGGVSWALDDRKIACDPYGIFQWHALWHVATAAGAYWLYRFFNEPNAVATERVS